MGMAMYSSILAWRVPWTEKSGGLQPIQSQRVRHDSVTNTTLPAHWERRKRENKYTAWQKKKNWSKYSTSYVTRPKVLSISIFLVANIGQRRYLHLIREKVDLLLAMKKKIKVTNSEDIILVNNISWQERENKNQWKTNETLTNWDIKQSYEYS